MKKLLLSIAILLITNYVVAQVGIGNTNPQASLDISTKAIPDNTDGILIPRIDNFPTPIPTAAQDGMMVFATGAGTPAKGFYYWDSSGAGAWVAITVVGGGTLDEAYDFGGAGTGRIVTADNGAVEIQGVGGLRVEDDIVAAESIIHDGDANTFMQFTPDRIQFDAGGRNYIDIQHTNQEIAFNEDSTESDFRIESGAEANMFFVDGSENHIGIGTNSPATALHIDVTTPFDLEHLNIGQDDIFLSGGGLNVANAVGASIGFGGTSNRAQNRRAAISSVQTGGDVDFTGLAFYVHGNPVNQSPMVEGMRLTHQRYLGINNNAPSANLDVIGTLQFEDGNEAAGFVLTSDATGNASWVDPNSIVTLTYGIDDLTDGKSDSDGSEDGSSIFLGINAGAADNSDNNRNVGIGYLAMEDNVDGSQNTAIGYHALLNNIDGSANTALGDASLDANTTGIWNTGIGQSALSGNVDGAYNTAVGRAALAANSDGNSNVAVGVNAYAANTSGSFNTVIGVDAATGLTASSNTIIGRRAMNSYSAGGQNVAIGAGAGYYGSGIQNTFVGTSAGNLVGTGERNGSVFVGYGAGSNEAASNTLYIENSAANADNALIYGEFDNNILRTNGELQIGNPTGTGYALPTDQGTANDVLTSNGDGTTQWAASVTPIIDPKYPDGFQGMTPVLLMGATLTYTVPVGQNFYITSVYSNNNGYILTIDGMNIQHAGSNSASYTPVTNPIIVAAGQVVVRSSTQQIVNGFLVNEVIEPITQPVFNSASYTVPAGRILVLLSAQNVSVSNTNDSFRIIADGANLYFGTGNTKISGGLHSNSFFNPIFLPSGTVLSSSATSLDYNINGYLIDE